MLTSFDIRALALAGLLAVVLPIAGATPGIAAAKSARPGIHHALSPSDSFLKP